MAKVKGGPFESSYGITSPPRTPRLVVAVPTLYTFFPRLNHSRSPLGAYRAVSRASILTESLTTAPDMASGIPTPKIPPALTDIWH
jgi:hypothetical protein